MTRILTRRDLLGLLDVGEALTALEAGFRRAPDVPVEGRRIRTDLPFPGTATTLIPGLLPGIEAYTVKVNAKFPGARPALRGVICLHSGRDGELLALLDSATVTAWRTGLAAALGTDRLADPGETTVGVIGAGAQAAIMLDGVRALRGVTRLRVHDTDPDRAVAFAERHGGRAGSMSEVVGESGIVLAATWSRAPLFGRDETHDGQHVTSLGADEPGKQELGADLLTEAAVFVDDRSQAMAMGAVGNAGLPPETIAATLHDVVTGGHPGRRHRAERTVYAPVGLPWQDLALAWSVYRRAGEHGIGARVDLLAGPDDDSL